MTVITATSAFADIVTNDLDGSVDTTHELMQLTLPGSPGATELTIVEEGAPDQPNCNIPGAPHTLTLTPHYDDAVIDVAFPEGLVFDGCDKVLGVEVTPVGVGTTTVWFTYVADVPPSQGHPRKFSVQEAAFDVTVTATDGGGNGQVCDADPAAPAWANALLQGNGVKPKSGKNAPNYVAMVAYEMGTGATFSGHPKNAHPDYEKAVWAYLEAALGTGIQLPKGPSEVARPGWECTTVHGGSA